jgi:phosphoribosylanthranilate isomerase
MVPVKICGITNLKDALLCQKAGVSALGFVFAPSKRQVTVAQVQQITVHLSPFILKVGVFVDEDPFRIREIMSTCRLDLAQLHGDETPDDCRILSGRVLKAFRAGRDRPNLCWQGAAIRGIIIDSYSTEALGGTGKTFNWDLFTDFRKLGFPLILAGGLNPGNITTALRSVYPDGIDLSSGVEQQPGIKDPIKIRELLAAVASLPDSEGNTIK